MRMRKKADLPSKVCQHCARPFIWRKKWEKVWEEVKYCSDACRRSTPSLARHVPKAALNPTDKRQDKNAAQGLASSVRRTKGDGAA